jgi:hypothetical protein
VSEGLAIGLRTPNGVSPGPTARTSTRRGIVPAITKPTVDDSPTSSVDRTDTLDSGAALGMSANENRPVVVVVPCTVVYVPAVGLVNTKLVVAAGVLPDAGTVIVAVFGPVTL